MTKNVA